MAAGRTQTVQPDAKGLVERTNHVAGQQAGDHNEQEEQPNRRRSEQHNVHPEHVTVVVSAANIPKQDG